MRPAKFRTTLSWEDGSAKGAEEATWGELTITLGDAVVWGSQDGQRGVRWTWVDLLEHLAEVWPWLMFEEGWPAGPVVHDATRFLSDARAWAEALPSDEAAKREDELFEYRHRHDLAMAVQGKVLPQLWIVREGLSVWVASESTSLRLTFDEVSTALAALASQIVDRLTALDDERASGAVAAWESRNEMHPSKLAAIAVGVSEGDLLSLAQGDLATTFEIALGDAGSFAPNELLAAARMAVPTTDPSVVRSILVAMHSVEGRETAALDRLAAEAGAEFAKQDGNLKPAILGYHLACWLRTTLGLHTGDRADPEDLLSTWSVVVRELSLEDENIEAVACWGARHGPAVLVNTQGRHSRSVTGRRATLAHEICHLLVDRDAALPLAEVLGGHISAPLEQQARAFAAEFLLPREIAGAEFYEATDPAAILEGLGERYAVSKEIIAWQAYNSRYAMDWDTFRLLRAQVSSPDRFSWTVASRSSWSQR